MAQNNVKLHDTMICHIQLSPSNKISRAMPGTCASLIYNTHYYTSLLTLASWLNLLAVTKSTGNTILTPFSFALAIRPPAILDPSSSKKEEPIWTTHNDHVIKKNNKLSVQVSSKAYETSSYLNMQ